jgi:Ferritin-like domain
VSATRRQFLGRGLGLAGAAALPTPLLPATVAFAQASDETDALEPVVELEQAAELAYSLAVEDGDLKADVQRAFELFASHCDDHAVALSEALDQLGVDPPDAESDPAQYEALADFDERAPEKQLLEFMIGIEEDLVTAYREATPELEAPDLVRTAAQIAASHAQILVALRVLAGEPDATLAELP